MKKFNPIYLIICLVILLMISISAFIYIENKNYNDNKLSKQNISALCDSIRIQKNKYNEIIYSKSSLMMNIEELEKVNKKLYFDIKHSEDKIILITDLYLSIKKQFDSLSNQISIIESFDTECFKDGIYKNLLDKNNAYKINWNISDSSDCSNIFNVQGISVFNVNIINNKILFSNIRSDLEYYTQSINVKVGTQINKSTGLYEFFAKTNNMNISFKFDSYISPEIITKQQKNWNVGPVFGIGIGTDFKNSNFTMPDIFIGVGISYSLFSF